MDFEQAHCTFMETHTNERAGERRGGCCVDTTMRRNCFYRMYGGRCLSSWSSCIRNTEYMTGTASRNFWILLFCLQAAAVSESNAMVFRVMLKRWTVKNSAMHLTGIPS